MAVLQSNETIAHAVPLAAAVLVVTDRGEAEARAGDYLIVTDQGRQMTMTADEYRAATGAAESSIPGIPEAGSSPAAAKRRVEVPAVLQSFLQRKPPAETRAPLANASALATGPQPPPAEVLEAPPGEAGVSNPINSYQIDTSPVPLAPAPEAAPVVRPPPPSQEGRSLLSLENLVIPKRSEGSFRRFMRPGPVEAPKAPKKKAKKRPMMVLPFQKKKAKKEQDPKKERYRYVKPEWV